MDVDEFIKKNGAYAPRGDAGILKRLMAFIFDLLTLNIISFSLIVPSVSKGIVTIDDTIRVLSGPAGNALLAVVFFTGVIALMYFSLLEYAASATIGMMLFGIRVEGDPPFWKCVVRNIFIIPAFPFTVLWVIEPLFLIFKKRRLLEDITRTRTIESKP